MRQTLMELIALGVLMAFARFVIWMFRLHDLAPVSWKFSFKIIRNQNLSDFEPCCSCVTQL